MKKYKLKLEYGLNMVEIITFSPGNYTYTYSYRLFKDSRMAKKYYETRIKEQEYDNKNNNK